jgi:hypothetical protein
MTAEKRRRIRELQSDRALDALTRAERDELARLLAETSTADDAKFDLAAAALDLAASPPSRDPMPAALAAKIERAAKLVVVERPKLERAQSTTAAGSQVVVMPLGDSSSPERDWTRWGGWLAAAAVVCLFVGQRMRGDGVVTPARTATAAPSVSGASRSIPIVATAGSLASGELAWDDATGRGELRVHGLPAGDYELWIEDGARGAGLLLAGGSFTAAAGGDVVVPVAPAIVAKRPTRLLVSAPTAGRAMAAVVVVDLAAP